MVNREGTSLFKIDKDYLEKKLRLIDILEYLNTNPTLSNCLALKGGTAICLDFPLILTLII